MRMHSRILSEEKALWNGVPPNLLIKHKPQERTTYSPIATAYTAAFSYREILACLLFRIMVCLNRELKTYCSGSNVAATAGIGGGRHSCDILGC